MFGAIAAHRRSPPLRFAARLSHAYLRAYENVNHNLETNGEAALVRRMDAPIRTAIDVGMHQGAWTDTVLRLHPHAVVHGFEAAPGLASDLQRRYVADQRVVVNPYGLGAAPGRALLHVNPTHSSLNSLVADPRAPAGEAVEVELARGDDYLEQHGLAHVDFLKVDVEGYDLEVLEGFGRALAARAIDVVQFEYNRWTLVARHFLADFYDLLGPLGYTIGKVHPGGVDFRPYRLDDENWRGPACVAVLSSNQATLKALAGARM
jgi:FkbM family methyltransferase